jgi:hypothetical protein
VRDPGGRPEAAATSEADASRSRAEVDCAFCRKSVSEVAHLVKGDSYEAPFKPTALQEIVVGKTHASLDLPVAEAMRSKFQLEHVDVREGHIALRTFS